MIDARRLYYVCFHAAVAVSQAFIAVVAGVAVAFALWSYLGSRRQQCPVYITWAASRRRDPRALPLLPWCHWRSSPTPG
jgi:hypothetical protein